MEQYARFKQEKNKKEKNTDRFLVGKTELYPRNTSPLKHHGEDGQKNLIPGREGEGCHFLWDTKRFFGMQNVFRNTEVFVDPNPKTSPKFQKYNKKIKKIKKIITKRKCFCDLFPILLFSGLSNILILFSFSQHVFFFFSFFVVFFAFFCVFVFLFFFGFSNFLWPAPLLAHTTFALTPSWPSIFFFRSNRFVPKLLRTIFGPQKKMVGLSFGTICCSCPVFWAMDFLARPPLPKTTFCGIRCCAVLCCVVLWCVGAVCVFKIFVGVQDLSVPPNSPSAGPPHPTPSTGPPSLLSLRRTAQNYAFFPSPPTIFSLWESSRGILGGV